MAGHSKWANIKHRKGRQDAKKGKVFTKLGKAISVAARQGGSDPNSNSALKDAIAKAKAANMPNDTVDRAIKRGAGELGGADYERVTYEGYGPGGVAVIVEALTDNRNRTAGDIRHAFDKNGGNLGTTGCVSFMFDKKGQIMIEKDDDIDEDELMMAALEAGAEDIEVDEEGYSITTTPEDFSSVVEMLEENSIKPVSAEVAMIPQTTAELTGEEDLKYMNRLIDMIEDNEDVQDVFHNWEMDEE